MNCSDFEINIEAFVKGSLNALQSKAMKEHCAECPSCARFAKVDRFIIGALDETEQFKAPKTLAGTIVSSGETEELYSCAETDLVSYGLFDIRITDCRDFEKYAAAFVEGCLYAELTGAMKEHLAGCQTCERTAEAHRLVYASLDYTETVRAPEGLADTILAAVQGETVKEIKASEKTLPYFYPGELLSGLAASGLLIAAYIFSSGMLAKRFPGIAGWMERLYAIWPELAYLSVREKLINLLSKVIPPYNEIIELLYEIITPLAEKISYLFSTAIQIPYTTQTFPLYYLAALFIVFWSTWTYLKPLDTACMSFQSDYYKQG